MFVFPVAVLIGYLAGGRLRNLSSGRFRWPLAGLSGVALQFVPASGTVDRVLLVVSFLLLAVAAGINRRLPGFPLILVGLSMNFLVITVNDGMPITGQAIVASGQADTMKELVAGAGGSKHHLATEEDELLFLGDAIPIPAPVSQAVSVGDLFACGGAMWFVVRGMRRASGVPSAERSQDAVVAEMFP